MNRNPLVEDTPEDTISKVKAVLMFLADAALNDEHPCGQEKTSAGHFLILETCWEALEGIPAAIRKQTKRAGAQ